MDAGISALAVARILTISNPQNGLSAELVQRYMASIQDVWFDFLWRGVFMLTKPGKPSGLP